MFHFLLLLLVCVNSLAALPRVLHINLCEGKGGTEQHGLELMRQSFAYNRYSVCLVGSRSWLAQELHRQGLPYEETTAPRFLHAARGIHDAILTQRIMSLCDLYNFSIIHCNNLQELLPAKAAAKKYGCRVFFTRHVNATIGSASRCNKYLSGVDTIIATDPRAANYLHTIKNQHDISVKRIAFIPPLISSKQEFSFDEYQKNQASSLRTIALNDQPFTLLIVANFYSDIKSKKHYVLIDAAADVIKRGYQLKVVCAGTGPSESTIKKRAVKNKISEHVEFLGFVKDVAPLIDAADAVTLVSGQDCFGISLLEGCARGKPGIAPRNSGPGVIVDDGTTGLLFEEDNAQDLADKIIYLIEHPDERRRMGEAAAVRIATVFSPEQVFQKITALYRSA